MSSTQQVTGGPVNWRRLVFRHPASVGITGAVLSIVVATQALASFGGDPSGFARFSEGAAIPAEEILGRPVVVAPGSGHDGKFFFALATDPLLLGEWVGERLDDPVYRARRILYPFVAGLGGLAPAWWILWSLLGVNLFAVGFGTWALAVLARDLGVSIWLGLAFAFNPGNLFELLIDGSSVLGFSLVLCGVLAWTRDRPLLSAVLLLGGALSRETMLIAAAGLVAYEFIESRSIHWRQLLVPVIGVIGWSLYAAARLPDGPAGGESLSRNFSFPFGGVSGAMARWLDTAAVADAVVFAAVAIAAGVILWTAVTKRSRLGWSVVGFAFLLMVLDAPVVLRAFDLTRSIAPLLSVAPIMLLMGRPTKTAAP